jgi:hypothetical protein
MKKAQAGNPAENVAEAKNWHRTADCVFCAQ